MFRLAAGFLLVLFSLSLHADPVRLRTNYRERPLGIDTATPRLSWQSNSVERNWMQQGYRILVASRADLARAGKADVWDSGRKDSAESVDIAYSGPALTPRHRYFWTVQVWDNHGHTAVAAPSWFETGMLSSPWTAQWITADRGGTSAVAALHWLWLPGTDALRVTPGTVARFRYTLTLDKLPARVLLSVAAHGDFVTTVNGLETGRKARWSTFDGEDILGPLHTGANEIVVTVKSPPLPGPPGQPAPAGPATAGMTALLTLGQPDGTSRRIGTEGWQASTEASNTWTPAQVVLPISDARMGVDPGLPPQPALLLRHDFSAGKPLKQARLYVTAAGSYRMSLNGQRIGDTYLTPDFTDYRKRLLYQTYDVTSLIKSGANTVGAELGDGWYASPLTWTGAHNFSGPVRLLAQLELDYADGTHATIASDDTWKASSSPVLASDIYSGEMYDARLEQPGWDATGFDESRWAPAQRAAAPEGFVTAQTTASVHLTQTLDAKSVTTLANGDALFDMGQNMVGWARLKVAGPSGTSIRMRFAERLKPDGSVYTENLRNAEAEDIYTLRGGPAEEFAPKFTFHGFRYVQVSGLPARPTTAMLRGEVLNSLEDTPSGRLKTSSDLLNRMWDLGIWGQRGNFLSIPTDCPQRDERLGWMGDAGVFWRTGSYNFDIASFTTKFSDDMVDGQNPEGAYANVSPNLLGPSPGAPGWGDAGVIVPYTAWLQYGDRSLAAANWPAMERWMNFIAENNPNFLRQKALGANFADWLAPDPNTPRDLIGTAYWALIAHMMEQMAVATGHDSVKYATLFANIRNAYQKAYLAADGTVSGGTQTGYLITLYAHLAPESMRADLTARLAANIDAHQTHLTTGFLGTPFLLFALSENKQTDLAYKLLLQDTYPSWGYMVAKGATTWWERWNGDSGDPAMNSYNHYSFGSVVAWMYQQTSGIDADPSAPGFRHMLLRPTVTPRLNFAHGEYDSVYGTITTDWRRRPDGALDITVTVPPNTSANFDLQGATIDPATLKSYKAASPGIELGAGTYHFRARSMPGV